MNTLFGTVLENAVIRKINNLKLADGQLNEKIKLSFVDTEPYSKCNACGKALSSTEVYGEWEDYCVDCYIKDNPKK